MLQTPLGEIQVLIDGKAVEYSAEETEYCERFCPDLNGRYFITVIFKPDGKEHLIACVIKNFISSVRDDIEAGERLELKSFYRNNIKLSIGMEGESGYLLDGCRASDAYDYDNDYLDDGVQYIILKNTKTKKYVFGIAWIENVNDSNDVQTWFGADPTFLQGDWRK